MRPKTKVLSYLKRMISLGKFKVNDKLPSIQAISNTLDVSLSTIRKAIQILDQEKIVQNYGRLGVFVMSDAMVRHHRHNRIGFLAHMASLNVDLSLIANDRYKVFGNYGIALKDDYIYALNFITHKKLRTTKTELEDILSNPITVDHLLNTSESQELRQAKMKFRRQKSLAQVARIVHLHQKELELNG